jgi:acyl-coenzyme A thioesterase PaaI-like protein
VSQRSIGRGVIRCATVSTDETTDRESLHERLAHQRAQVEAASPNAAAKREFAAAMREILEELDASGAPPEMFSEHAARLRELVGELRRHRTPSTGPSVAGFTGMETFHERSPIVGLANPLAPPAVLEHFPEERRVAGRVEFGKAFEGGPGLVHGGFLAALLDEVLGVVTVYSGTSGMTGEYTLRYHAPTRIKVPLRFEARFDRADGRKLHVSGDLWDGETRTVSARGLFIAVDAAKFEAFHAARTERMGER